MPEVEKLIEKQLKGIQDSGVALNSLSIRAIMVGIIKEHANSTLADGTRFRCSESFVRKYITNNLDWSF